MRWDRLFAELEAQAEDDLLAERDALVADLRDAEWAETSWRSLLGGSVELEVKGVGRVAGAVRLVNDDLVHLVTPVMDHLVACTAVTAVLASDHRADEPGRVASRLGWRQVLRRARDDGDEGRFTSLDGSLREGAIDVVGLDFVRVLPASGRGVVVPTAELAAVSFRR